jgi:hypothetical protein
MLIPIFITILKKTELLFKKIEKDIEYKIRKSNQSINAALVLTENNFHN